MEEAKPALDLRVLTGRLGFLAVVFLVGRVAESLAAGTGAATATAFGLGTLALPGDRVRARRSSRARLRGVRRSLVGCTCKPKARPTVGPRVGCALA
jgi:hypothetical protein